MHAPTGAAADSRQAERALLRPLESRDADHIGQMADLDADGNLLTDSGRKVSQLSLAPSMFVDRTIAIYGPSGTGKTVIVKNIMKIVQPHIEQVLIVAPSEPTNRSYEGFVDSTLIHYSLYLAPLPGTASSGKETAAKAAMRFLEAVWKRQEMMAAIYNRANNATVLASLFGRLPKEVRARGIEHINSINARREGIIRQISKQFESEPGRRDAKTKEINEKFKKMLSLIYKQFIVPNYESLYAAADLSDDERYSLCYIKFNPRLLLIFDDCAAQLKPFFNKDIFRLLFYQNRHSFITVVLCCQDDTDLPTNLRKNAFVSFFTENIVCLSNFERSSNQFPKQIKTYVSEIAPSVFRGNRKLAYIREDDKRKHFYHIEFPLPQPSLFGSSALAELCGEVRGSGSSMDTKNPYYSIFSV